MATGVRRTRLPFPVHATGYEYKQAHKQAHTSPTLCIIPDSARSSTATVTIGRGHWASEVTAVEDATGTGHQWLCGSRWDVATLRYSIVSKCVIWEVDASERVRKSVGHMPHSKPRNHWQLLSANSALQKIFADERVWLLALFLNDAEVLNRPRRRLCV